MRYSNFASPLLALLLAGAGTPALAQSQAQQVAAAAQRDFTQFVQYNVQQRAGTLPTEFPLDVDDVQDLKDAKLGHGFPVYTIDTKDLLMGRGDLRSMARPTGAWRYVISLQGRAIGLATVEQSNGRWEVTSYGAAGLARELDAAVAVHGNAARSNLRFIRIYQAMADLLEVASPHDARVRFAPLHSARQMLKAQEGGNKLLDQGELLEPLRASVRSNLDAFR